MTHNGLKALDKLMSYLIVFFRLTEEAYNGRNRAKFCPVLTNIYFYVQLQN